MDPSCRIDRKLVLPNRAVEYRQFWAARSNRHCHPLSSVVNGWVCVPPPSLGRRNRNASWNSTVLSGSPTLSSPDRWKQQCRNVFASFVHIGIWVTCWMLSGRSADGQDISLRCRDAVNGASSVKVVRFPRLFTVQTGEVKEILMKTCGGCGECVRRHYQTQLVGDRSKMHSAERASNGCGLRCQNCSFGLSWRGRLSSS